MYTRWSLYTGLMSFVSHSNDIILLRDPLILARMYLYLYCFAVSS